MDENIVKTALFQLFQQAVENRQLLCGVTLGLSAAGKSRLEIMTFFWNFMTKYEDELSESQMNLVGDFCHDLLGRGPVEHIIRLLDDPEDVQAFVQKVTAEARLWKAPS